MILCRGCERHSDCDTLLPLQPALRGECSRSLLLMVTFKRLPKV